MKASSKTLVMAAALGAAACSDERAALGPDRLSVRVAPLHLDGVTNARYTLTVSTHAGQTVWSRAIDADRFGDGVGGVAYVGACDASPEAQPNVVTLVLDGLDGASGPIPTDTWQNPTPVALTVTCRENADTPVDFDLVVLRDADQGFFDVAVTFSDLFCSAKFDCQDALLHDGDVRAPTGVLAFACTSGQGEPTTLYMSDVTVTCDGLPPTIVNPALGPGQHPVAGDILFGTASYFGKEALPGLDKCYWNTALGLALAPLGELGANPTNCHVRAAGTATPTAFDAGRTPDGTRWPVVTWDVALTDGAGQWVCGAHALNGPDGAVATRYSEVSGETFRWPYRCGEHPKLTCAGATATALGTAIVVDDKGSGALAIDVGAAHTELQLPPGVTLADDVGCCIAPCCDVAGAGR